MCGDIWGCANDEIGVYGMWWRCAPRDLFIYVLLCTGNELMMKNGVCGMRGDAVYEYLFLYVILCAFMCWQCVNDEIGVCGMRWKCAP